MWKRLRGFALVEIAPGDSSMAQEGAALVTATERANEIGFTLCRARNGKLVRGPMASGTPMNVDIPLKCPSDSQMVGLFHTHPGGVPYPSDIDLKSAARVGVSNLCIDADGTLNCFRLRKRGRK